MRTLIIANGPGNPPLLENVSFSIKPGEALGVTGRNRAGKTTMAEALLGLVDPNLGEVRPGDASVRKYRRAEFRTYIGYLPQEPKLINSTIAENIARMELAPSSETIG